MSRYIEEGVDTTYEKLENFPRYVSRNTLARFPALYEIFKRALNVQGDIIICGATGEAA